MRDTKKCACWTCIHWDMGDCEAFPNGIPNRILFGQIKHEKVLKGEQVNDFVYTPNKRKIEIMGE